MTLRLADIISLFQTVNVKMVFFEEKKNKIIKNTSQVQFKIGWLQTQGTGHSRSQVNIGHYRSIMHFQQNLV